MRHLRGTANASILEAGGGEAAQLRVEVDQDGTLQLFKVLRRPALVVHAIMRWISRSLDLTLYRRCLGDDVTLKDTSEDIRRQRADTVPVRIRNLLNPNLRKTRMSRNPNFRA
jgi:hypothetical protein